MDIGSQAIAAIATLAVAILAAAGLFGRKVTSWMSAHDNDARDKDLVKIALYGREEEGPLPRINGLIYDNKKTQRCLGAMTTSIQRIDVKLASLDTKATKLVERTEANDGSSIKDQVTRIDERSAQLDRIEASGDRGEASRERSEASGSRIEEHLDKNDPDVPQGDE
jgi:hypothetical protein